MENFLGGEQAPKALQTLHWRLVSLAQYWWLYGRLARHLLSPLSSLLGDRPLLTSIDPGHSPLLSPALLAPRVC